MKNKLLEHPGLKLAALALAILLWLIITNFNDPIITKTFTDIPVTVTNASYIEAKGQSYKISDNDNMVDVTVRANRSNVERLSAANISATADMTQIISLETDPVMVPINVSVPGITSESVTPHPGNISIELEDMVSDDFVVTATTGTTRPAKGYEVGKLEVNPETVTIRGPGSLVNIIERVTANVDVSLITRDTEMASVIKIYDRNGTEFTDAQMSYLTLSVEQKDIRVYVTLHRVINGVTITAETSGEPAAGYQIGKITVTPSTVSLVGSREALENLEQSGNCIVIPADTDLINVDGASSDQDIRVDISKLLPEGISLAEDVSSTAVVSVQILPYDSKSISAATKNITVNGLPSGMNCVFAVNMLEIKVQGADDVLEKVTAEDIQMSVDLTGMSEGVNTVPVSFTLPEGCELVEPVTVDAVISETKKKQ